MSTGKFKHEPMQIQALLIASVIVHYADEREAKINNKKNKPEICTSNAS